MTDFVARPATRADAEALNALLAAAEAVDRTDEHHNLEDVVEELDNPMIDLSKDWTMAVVDGQVVGHARLLPRAPVDGAVSVSVDGTVHPAHRRRGLGSFLAHAMVLRAVDYAWERGLRPVVTASALSTNTDAERILRTEGLLPERWSFLMQAQLGVDPEGPAPYLPEGYSVHTWVGVEHDEVRAAHNQAFVGHYGFTEWSAEMWEQWVSGSRGLRPALSLLARDEAGAIAAYVQTSEYDAVAEATGIREAYVAKVGTLAEHRGRGLAGVLLRMALDRCRADGFDRAALDVDSENATGALGVYERAGFRTDLRWTSYRLMD